MDSAEQLELSKPSLCELNRSLQDVITDMGGAGQPSCKRKICRRSLCFDNLAAINGPTNNENNEHRLGGVQEKGATPASTEQCFQKLKIEKEAWRTMYEERKRKYMENLNSGPHKLDWDNCADVLSDEDKQFLNDQPHYEKTVSKLKNVEELASICMYMKHKTAHTSAKIISIAEQQGAAVKENIFKHEEAYYT